MAERGEYIDRFNEGLTEDEAGGIPPEFGAEEAGDKLVTITDRLDTLIITEDNEDLVSDINSTIEHAKTSYENSNKQEVWDELWARLSAEVIERLEDEDIDAADTNWTDLKLELLRLSKG